MARTASNIMLTRVEELILLSVWRLQGDAYGAAIRNHLTDQTGKDWPIATVYTPLDRLSRKGLLRSHTGRPTKTRGGRSKKMYRLTAKGVLTLQSVRRLNQSMWLNLPDPAVEI